MGDLVFALIVLVRVGVPLGIPRVPLPAIIADLGPNLPNNAIGLEGLLFGDGFESGDTSRWSSTTTR